MGVDIRSGMAEYLVTAHAITGDFGTYGRSVSKIEYYVNLIA
jgi:hypothetical protein